MPTLWDPWPGKMKAIEVISSERSPSHREHGRTRCKVARIRPGSYAQRRCPTDPPRCAPPGPTAPRRAIARIFEADLSAPVVAAGIRAQNPREISERVAMGRALWRELVIGFASQLGSLRLGFTQLAALYVLADSGTTTVSDLADAINRSPSATSRLVDGLVRRRLVERRVESEDRRQRTRRADPARTRPAADGRPGPGGPVPVGRPAAAGRRAGPDRDGRRRAGHPRDLPPGPPDPLEARLARAWPRLEREARWYRPWPPRSGQRCRPGWGWPRSGRSSG